MRRAKGTGQIFRVGNVWKIRYTVNGRRIQETAGPRKQDAVELLKLRLGAAAEGRFSADALLMRWEDLEVIILDEHRQHRSFEKVERHVRRHLRRFFAGWKVARITFDALLRYKQHRLAEGASPSTVRYELSLLCTGLVVAQKAGRLATLPPIPSVRVENTRTSFFEPGEFEALRAHLPPIPRAVVTFMYWTGWRRNEVLSRQWRHVDFQRGVIVLEPGETKNGEGRVFPFSEIPELDELLRELRRETEAVQRRLGRVVPWVFHRDGKPVKSIRQAWRSACRKAGLVGKIPHDFRRTAVRRLEFAGVPRSVAMKLVGHRSEAIYRRYAITKDEDLREGLRRALTLDKAQIRHGERLSIS
jgi:integrase